MMGPSRQAALAGFMVGVLHVGNACLAGEADVIAVVHERAADTHAFSVTVRHADEGWDHYADRFEIVGPDGTVLAVRELAHPHVDEQPFTRFLGGAHLPQGVDEITVRARDSVHGYGGQELSVLTRKAYSCGVPAGSGLTPPEPEPVSGRLKCPRHPPGPPTAVEDPE